MIMITLNWAERGGAVRLKDPLRRQQRHLSDKNIVLGAHHLTPMVLNTSDKV